MYDREEYEWYKTHGICVRCRKAKARSGRTTCAASVRAPENNLTEPTRESGREPEPESQSQRAICLVGSYFLLGKG